MFVRKYVQTKMLNDDQGNDIDVQGYPHNLENGNFLRRQERAFVKDNAATLQRCNAATLQRCNAARLQRCNAATLQRGEKQSEKLVEWQKHLEKHKQLEETKQLDEQKQLEEAKQLDKVGKFKQELELDENPTRRNAMRDLDGRTQELADRRNVVQKPGHPVRLRRRALTWSGTRSTRTLRQSGGKTWGPSVLGLNDCNNNMQTTLVR